VLDLYPQNFIGQHQRQGIYKEDCPWHFSQDSAIYSETKWFLVLFWINQ
jgi:hypothetical protein